VPIIIVAMMPMPMPLAHAADRLAAVGLSSAAT
jgi:hypothetical protein